MRYLPCFQLRLAHEYYSNTRCQDFAVSAQPLTRRLLKNHRCILKELPDGIRLLTMINDAKEPLIPFPKVLSLRFDLYLKNPDFAIFTDFSMFSGLTAPLFTHAEKDTQLRPKSKTAYQTERFNVAAPASIECFKLAFKPLEDIDITDFVLQGPSSIQLNGFNADVGQITINSRNAVKGTKFTITYPVKPVLGRKVFAQVLIDYRIDRHPPGSDPVTFSVRFTSRQAKWKYYLVTDPKKKAADFQISASQATPQDPAPPFSDFNRSDLSASPDPHDDVARELNGRFPGKKLFRFISDNPIFFRQLPRKNLQLTMNGIPIIAVLPNPSIQNFTQINSSVDENRQKEKALFEVIKYLTQPI